MKVIGAFSILGLLWPMPLLAQSLSEKEKKQTVSWLQSLQRDNGGFAADPRPDTPASLPATAMALQALRGLSAEPRNKASCAKFVIARYDQKNTAFAAIENGKISVRATAFGLMAVAGLKLPADKYVVPAVIYLCSSVKKLEDIYVTAAAYEAVQSKCELAEDWIAKIQERQQADGTFGAGSGRVRDTSEAVLALVRLGGRVEKRDSVLKNLRDSQRPDGGWGTSDEQSNVETTGKVVRAMFMLKSRGELSACCKFLARCRHDDGSYGSRPGEPGNLPATFSAVQVLRLSESKKD